MENSVALNGIQRILSRLEDEELFGLASTVTQGFLQNKVENRKDAIEAVLKYSPDVCSILKRKIVTRDVLFRYLYEENVPVTLPAKKNDLIDVICTHWNLKLTQDSNAVKENIIANITDSQTYTSPSEVNTLALKFSEWFYNMMNTDQPVGIEHFWNDAKLKMNLVSAAQSVNQEIEDVEEIVQVLYKTKCEHKLYFNPNLLSEGIQGRIDPHGLVAVLVCGTLHSNNSCVGVFEQVFMLARDPFSDNNWKIKNTELNLRSRDDVQELPRLCDNSLTSNLLSLPSR